MNGMVVMPPPSDLLETHTKSHRLYFVSTELFGYCKMDSHTGSTSLFALESWQLVCQQRWTEGPGGCYLKLKCTPLALEHAAAKPGSPANKCANNTMSSLHLEPDYSLSHRKSKSEVVWIIQRGQLKQRVEKRVVIVYTKPSQLLLENLVLYHSELVLHVNLNTYSHM